MPRASLTPNIPEAQGGRSDSPELRSRAPGEHRSAGHAADGTGQGVAGSPPSPQLWRPWGGVARAPTETSRFATPSRLSLLTLTDRNKLQHLPYALLLLLPALTCYYLFSKLGVPLRGAAVGPGPSSGETSYGGVLVFLAQICAGDLALVGSALLRGQLLLPSTPHMGTSSGARLCQLLWQWLGCRWSWMVLPCPAKGLRAWGCDPSTAAPRPAVLCPGTAHWLTGHCHCSLGTDNAPA